MKRQRVTPDNLDVLDRLMQLYLYDFSVYFCDEGDGFVGPDGRFDPGFPLSRYAEGSGSGHESWLARVEGRWAGFALIGHRADQHPHGGPGRAVQEFFVLPCFRRKGIGTALARQVFDDYRGFWQIAQIAANRPATAFWRTVISRYTGGRYADYTKEERGRTLVWQTFDSSTW
jgi:predicted acetyltransferase